MLSPKKWRIGTKKMRVVEWVKEFALVVEPPFTIRQIFYQLLEEDKRQPDKKFLTGKTKKSYDNLDAILTEARRDGLLPISWFDDEERTTTGRAYHSIETGDSFYESAVGIYEGAQKRFTDSWDEYVFHRWEGQPNYVEVWFEKRALAKQFERATKKLGVLCQVCRGTSSLTSIYLGAARFQRAKRRGVSPLLLYFGDLDPTGWFNPKWIRRDMEMTFGVKEIEYVRCAVTLEQVEKLGLITKEANRRDSRYPKYVNEVGDLQADLEAIHPNTLTEIIEESVARFFDEEIYKQQKKDQEKIQDNLRERIEEYLSQND